MTQTEPEVGFLDGQFLPWKDCNLHISLQAVRYGFRAFEGIRAYWNDNKQELYLFRLNEHLDRLMETSKIMRIIPPYSEEEIAGIVIELFAMNGFRQDSYTQPGAYVGSGEVNSATIGRDNIGFMAFAIPIESSEKAKQVQNVCTSSWRGLTDTIQPRRMKVGSNYLNIRLARLEAAAGGYDNAILLTDQGKVSEALVANLFMVKNGIVVTPPATSDILEGVTRDTLIQLMKDEMNLNTVERDIDRTELYVADEVFLCGTGAEVTPVGSIDGIQVGTGNAGSLTKQLRQLYFGIVRGNNPKYMHWLTPVYNKSGGSFVI